MNYITTYLRKIISRGYYSTIHSHGWIVLFCAVILGRYYTDWYNVDEDMSAIPAQGGRWNDEAFVGIAFRYLYQTPTVMLDTVASKKNNIPPPT